MLTHLFRPALQGRLYNSHFTDEEPEARPEFTQLVSAGAECEPRLPGSRFRLVGKGRYLSTTCLRISAGSVVSVMRQMNERKVHRVI